MKKVYSKKLGAEAYALAPEQLDVLRDAGYSVPSPADVIADAGAAVITPPEGARAYVVMNLKTGEFSVRTRSCTLRNKTELGEFSGEVVRAGMVKALVERADPDRATPKKQETPDAESSAPATDPRANQKRAPKRHAYDRREPQGHEHAGRQRARHQFAGGGQMSAAFAFGTCRFCGQTLSLDTDYGTQEAADAAASELCDCFDAKEERAVQAKIRDARYRIRQVFGSEAERLGFKPVDAPEILDLMDGVAELVARGYVTSAALNIRGRGRVKISITAKEKIKVERHEVRSFQLEE